MIPHVRPSPFERSLSPTKILAASPMSEFNGGFPLEILNLFCLWAFSSEQLLREAQTEQERLKEGCAINQHFDRKKALLKGIGAIPKPQCSFFLGMLLSAL